MKRGLLLLSGSMLLTFGAIRVMTDGGAPAPPWPDDPKKPVLLADGGAPAPPWPDDPKKPILNAEGAAAIV